MPESPQRLRRSYTRCSRSERNSIFCFLIGNSGVPWLNSVDAGGLAGVKCEAGNHGRLFLGRLRRLIAFSRRFSMGRVERDGASGPGEIPHGASGAMLNLIDSNTSGRAESNR